jgi:hypothetical protein
LVQAFLKKWWVTQAERGFVKYSDTNTNSGRGDFRKERNFTNHNGFRFRQGKSATSGTGKPPVDGAWKNSHYLKIYPNRDDAFELGATLTTESHRVRYWCLCLNI